MAKEGNYYSDENIATKFDIIVDGVSTDLMEEITVREVVLGESLLTPGLQTFVKVHSFLHTGVYKNYDEFKGKTINIDIERKVLAAKDTRQRRSYRPNMEVSQTIYRIDNRKLINNQNEEFTIRACDDSQLNDLETLVSKSWKCATPSSIAAYVLRTCAGVRRLDIEPSNFPSDYTADNIHPFQVVNQQANRAVYGADDPSFVHYMTYDNLGTHHFRSLKSLSSQEPMIEYTYDETSNSYKNVDGIMTYSFPCDFDLMSDILNGIDRDGRDINSALLFNPWNKSFSLLGSQITGCGIGAGVIKNAITNMNSARNQGMCPDYTNVYILKRQSRMALLDKDKVALRLTVPFNTELHAGKVIRIKLYNKETGFTLYGSGDYLIVSMFHQILAGGLGTTTMECVSRTAGRKGIV
jgi:hypothetical protein